MKVSIFTGPACTRIIMKTNEKSSMQKMVLTAMMMCLVMLMTYIIRIPIPSTQGYIHLGDCMIFFSVLLLGWKWGAVAAGVGSALADLLGGYAYYAPITLAVKAFMAIAVGVFIQAAIKRGAGAVKLKIMEIIGMIIGGAVMVAGYYLAESIMYGNWITPIWSAGMNVVQFVVGTVIATVLAMALYKTPVGKLFEYRLIDTE